MFLSHPGPLAVLKGYPSGQIKVTFAEINVNLAKKNDFCHSLVSVMFRNVRKQAKN